MRTMLSNSPGAMPALRISGANTRLRSSSSSVALSGRILDEAGNGVPDATIYAVNIEGVETIATTDISTSDAVVTFMPVTPNDAENTLYMV